MNRNVKLFGKKSFVSCLLSLLLIVIVASTPTTAMAASGSKKITSSGKMSVVLNVGATGDSSRVSIRVSGLPANAKITKIEVNTGSLSFQGGVVTNYLTIESSNGRSEKIAWAGAANKTLTTHNFLASTANGTYTLYFNSTCVGGAIVGGQILSIGTKTYSRPYITVFWDDTL